MEQLRGRIGLLDFWDFTCINCLRTLPYKREWHAKYREMGLQILGIHTPEFDFARQEDVLRAAVGRLGIPWPVILDNDQSLWTSFANSVWPTVYLLDLDTKIRFRQEGEGHYGEIERSIQSLLVELDPSLDLPVISNPAAPEAAPGTACSPVTPELQLDSIHGLDNQSSRIQVFHLPEDRREGRTYLTGRWSIAGDGIAAAEKGCSITLTYSAGSCYTVLSPSPGAEPESALPLGFSPVTLFQDGEMLPPDFMGEDVIHTRQAAIVRVDAPRLYSLVHNSDVRPHELRIQIEEPGLTFYAFSFGTCMIPGAIQASRDKE